MSKTVKTFEYQLTANNGRAIRKATALVLEEGSVVHLTEKLSKREAEAWRDKHEAALDDISAAAIRYLDRLDKNRPAAYNEG